MAHAENAGGRGHGVLARLVHAPGDRDLLRRHDARPPTAAPAHPGGREAGVGALANEVTLELRERAEDVEDEPPPSGRRVDALLEAPEPDLALG